MVKIFKGFLIFQKNIRYPLHRNFKIRLLTDFLKVKNNTTRKVYNTQKKVFITFSGIFI